MPKKIFPAIIACLLSIALMSQLTAAAGSTAEKEARFTQKVKAGIRELGVGQASRVSLKLKDKTKLTGYITAIGEDSFVLADAKTAESRTVAYPDVVQVKGNNLSTGAKIAIWVAVAVAVIIVLYSVKGAFCDGC